MFNNWFLFWAVCKVEQVHPNYVLAVLFLTRLIDAAIFFWYHLCQICKSVFGLHWQHTYILLQVTITILQTVWNIRYWYNGPGWMEFLVPVKLENYINYQHLLLQHPNHSHGEKESTETGSSGPDSSHLYTTNNVLCFFGVFFISEIVCVIYVAVYLSESICLWCCSKHDFPCTITSPCLWQ